jgi:parallel beta-helix repeat protein
MESSARSGASMRGGGNMVAVAAKPGSASTSRDPSTTAANPVTNLTIRNCVSTGFTLELYLQYVHNLTVANCTITDADYAGILIASGIGGNINHNLIQRIGYTRTDFSDPAFANNAYGVILERFNTGNLMTDPQTSGGSLADSAPRRGIRFGPFEAQVQTSRHCHRSFRQRLWT